MPKSPVRNPFPKEVSNDVELSYTAIDMERLLEFLIARLVVDTNK